MHRRLVLEDLFLHGEERRLVKAEITRGAPGQPPRCLPEHRDQRPAHGVGEHCQVPEAGVKGRADHARQASPLQVGVLDEQPPVVNVDSLHRPPVLLHPPPGVPAPALNTRVVKRPPEPDLLQLVCLHAHDATAQRRHGAPRSRGAPCRGLGTGITQMPPGSQKGVQCAVADVGAAGGNSSRTACRPATSMCRRGARSSPSATPMATPGRCSNCRRDRGTASCRSATGQLHPGSEGPLRSPAPRAVTGRAGSAVPLLAGIVSWVMARLAFRR